jgi:molybdenum cofactor cytidylyltransferase
MGQPKQLMRIGSQTMLERVVDAAVGAGLGEVHVVLGHRAEEMRASLAGRPVRFVLNDAYQEGLGSSVRAGAAALSPDADAAIFVLADQPGITTAAIRDLIARSTPQNIVCASVGGRRTSPTVFGRRWFEELAQVSGEMGGRTIIEAHPEAVVLVELEADLRDVDTREDFAALS